MSIFNSLGSNYNLGIVFKSLFAPSGSSAKKDLIRYLENKYGGEVHLFYKGRQALEAAIKISNLSKGGFVAINGYTCFVVFKAVKNAGADVKYLDIHSDSLNFSVSSLKNLFESNTKVGAVIVQNTLGNPADIKEISAMCREKKVILIEDLAHSVGGVYGDFVVLSFSQDKIIDSVSGGALIIRNKKYQNTFQSNLKKVSLSQQIKDKFYPFLTYIIRVSYSFGLGKVIHTIIKRLHLLSEPIGKNNKNFQSFPNWYCVLALSCLKNMEKDIRHRKEIVDIYEKYIDASMKLKGNWIIRYPILVDKRAELIKRLKTKSFYVSDVWYDAPVAPKSKLKLTDYQKGTCPISEDVSEKMINLPTHKNINRKQAKILSELINTWQNSQQK